MILSYANGYGYYEHLSAEPYNDTDATLERLDLSDLEQNYTGFRFISPAAVPMKAGSETHSGADVGIFASGTFDGRLPMLFNIKTFNIIFYFLGPFSHLFHGVHENTYIYNVMAYSGCLGEYQNEPHCSASSGSFFTNLLSKFSPFH